MSEKLWGGRFREKPHPLFEAFNESFAVDRRLARFDVQGTRAHLAALESVQGVLAPGEAKALGVALDEIEASLDAGLPTGAYEDVHSWLEAALVAKVGELGRKIHAGRSRNDQVATALRLWTVDATDKVAAKLRTFALGLMTWADRDGDALFPAYTHLQRAQPILFAHWALAYVEPIERDLERLAGVRARAARSPLGSGACAGNGLGLDRSTEARALGFADVCRNSLDAVSDRDYVVDYHHFAALAGVHLSRWAEDLINYASDEFSLVRLGDAVCSGSSLLPQKRNPDALELIRGKSARLIGNLVQALTLLKGLPSTYNKDLQEDKESLFDSHDTLMLCLEAAALVAENCVVNRERAAAIAGRPELAAVDLADHAVKTGTPFRRAHEAVGQKILAAEAAGVSLAELPKTGEILEPFSATDFARLADTRLILDSKASVGGTAPARVKEALAAAKKRFGIG